MPIKQKPCYREELPAAQVILADITSEKAHHAPSALAQILKAKKVSNITDEKKASRCRSFCFAVKKNKHLGQLTFQQEQTQNISFAHFIKIIYKELQQGRVQV